MMTRLLALLALLLAPAPGWAYLVERGDTLFVSIAEQPEASREAKVNADGRIMLPLIGGVEAAGSDLDAIRGRIEAALAAADIIRKPTVIVEVAAYRPFYVGGAVTHPGSIAFEPGLTVRHALVLAGGVDRGDAAERPGTAELLELKADWRADSFALLQVRSRIARLEAELADRASVDLAGIDTSFVEPGTADEIRDIDAAQFRDRRAERAANAAHLQDLLALVDYEIQVLTEQGQHQAHEIELQRDQVANARELHEKGLIPLPRLQELEREESRLSRDMLENSAFAARARQNRATAEYNLSEADKTWRAEVRTELAAALLERERLESTIDILTGKLVAAGIALTADARLGEPALDIAIHRSVDGRPAALPASLDTELLPGDLLDVALAPMPNG